MFNVWFYFLSAAAQLGSNTEVTVDKTVIAPGERVSISITIPHSNSEITPTIDDRTWESSPLKILAREETSFDNQYRFRFEATGYLPGSTSIPSMSVAAGSRTFSTERIPLTISTTRDISDEQLRPHFDKMSLPLNWGLIVNILLTLSISIILGLYLRKYFNKPPPAPEAAPIIRPEDWFVRELERLLNEESSISHFMGAVHEYFSRLGNRGSSALTTSELTVFNSSKIKTLLPLIKRCDSYRYEPFKPSELELAIQIISETLRLIKCIN